MDNTVSAPFSGEVAELAELCVSITDCHHSTPTYLDKGKLVIRNFNIKNGQLLLNNPSYTDEESFQLRIKRAVPEPGDLIITREAPMGEVCIIPEGIECCLGQRMVLLKTNRSKVSSEFLLFALQSEFVQKQINKSDKTGSIVSNLRIPVLKELLVPRFDVGVESLICKSLTALENKIALNNKINAQLEGMARLLYEYWFVQFDFPDAEGKPYKSSGGKMVYNEQLKREIPEGWRAGNIMELTELIGGGTPKTGNRTYWDGNIPFFTPADSEDYIFSMDTKEKLTSSGLDNCSSRLFAKGTVFITARGTVGKVNVASTEMAMNQSCYALQGRPDIDYPFVYFYVHDLVKHVKSKASGSIFKALVTNDFKFTNLPVPTRSLIQRYVSQVKVSFEQILNNKKQNQQLAALRDWLLPMLMNGQVRVEEEKVRAV